jgi:hypothetical protein
VYLDKLEAFHGATLARAKQNGWAKQKTVWMTKNPVTGDLVLINNATCEKDAVLGRCGKVDPDWVPRVNHITTFTASGVSAGEWCRRGRQRYSDAALYFFTSDSPYKIYMLVSD